MIKLLIGGSPCTYWSIAQKNNRETVPSGMGWELFKNYLIAKEKFKPDFFLYENNKSAANSIKDEIKKQLGVTGCLFEENAKGQFCIGDGAFYDTDTGARYIEINSALVSAQNRQRFYVHNCGDVGQPSDRGILLRDVLESGIAWTEKSHALIASYNGAIVWNTLERHQRSMVAEPVNTTADGKAKALRASADKDGIRNFVGNDKDKRTCVAEPVCVQEQVFGRKASENGDYDRRYEARSDGKSGSLTGTNRQNAVAEPVCVAQRGRYADTGNRSKKTNGKVEQYYEARVDGKTNAITTVQKDNMLAEPVRVGDLPNGKGEIGGSQATRIYSIEGKSVNLVANGGGQGAKTGLYAIPVYYGAEAVEFDEDGKPTKARSYADGKIYTVYEVKDGNITIKQKTYPIKLADGFYIIRKLTVTECCRLQTLPDDYCRAVSASQAYKGLGNGWTAEVIIHILSHALKDIPRDEKILVLSMYDGIGTGRYCLDKMGFTNVEYHAYEIDKYAMQIAMSNYPDIIQHGDAFDVRNKEWKI